MMGGEYVVVETQDGEGIVGHIPEGASVPNDIAPSEAPLPLEEAHAVADSLNEANNPGEGHG